MTASSRIVEGSPVNRLVTLYGRAVEALDGLQPAAQLAARLYVAKVFFWSGLTKIRDWEITVALFTDEYHVPLLSPEAAALLGTAGELVLPVLLALGLSVVNVVAVISLAQIAEPALMLHVFWGSLLLGLVLWGPGRWSLDRIVGPHAPPAAAPRGGSLQRTG